MSPKLDAFLDLPIHSRILGEVPSQPPAAYVPTNRNFQFCPCCTPQKKLERRTIESGQERLKCDTCGWVYYDNPLMVSTGLVVFPERFIGQADIQGPFELKAGDFFEVGPNGCLKLKPTGIVAIQRKLAPFVGEWALPGGFTDWRETPRRGSFRECLEETGLKTCIRADTVVCACNPDPTFLNQNTVTQLALPVDGLLHAGDDASDARIYGEADIPQLCFSSHRRTVERWFRGRYAHLLKSFFLDPEAEVDEI